MQPTNKRSSSVPQSNSNPNAEFTQSESVVSINLRFSQTMMAVTLSSCISFVSGAVFTNNFRQSQVNNCTLEQPLKSTSVIPAPNTASHQD
ncbi:hypothetical protein [Nostoc sp.]